MNKEQKIALKTMAMKARVANFIRKELYKTRLDQISTLEKIAMFDKIFQMNHEMHYELKAYKWKRETKAERDRLRVERGWKPKIKTPFIKKDLVVSK